MGRRVLVSLLVSTVDLGIDLLFMWYRVTLELILLQILLNLNPSLHAAVCMCFAAPSNAAHGYCCEAPHLNTYWENAVSIIA